MLKHVNNNLRREDRTDEESISYQVRERLYSLLPTPVITTAAAIRTSETILIPLKGITVAIHCLSMLTISREWYKETAGLPIIPGRNTGK